MKDHETRDMIVRITRAVITVCPDAPQSLRSIISRQVLECMADIGPKWISAATQKPDDKAGILMVTNKGDIFSGRGVVFNGKLKPRDAGHGFVSGYYTHWMPLPKAPE